MAELITRGTWFKNLQRLKAKVDVLDPTKTTVFELNKHLESCERIWKKIDQAHDSLLKTCKDEAGADVQMTAFEPMEELYENLKSAIATLKTTVPPAVRQCTNIKLPNMSLPTFDGKFEDWQSFQDLFNASVHLNTSLSGSQKLQYLKTCLTGEAANLVKSFVITDANYVEAWQLLEQQYDIQREIIHSHVKKLLFQPSLKTESASSLQQMLNITKESISSLKVLGRPVDKWDDIITVLLIEKFDGDTKAEWARSLKGTDPPSFSELEDFMQQQIRTLHAKESVKQPNPRHHPKQQSNSQGRRLTINHTSASTCQHCNGTHAMYQCNELKELEQEKRHAAVKATGVCMNCLTGGHFTRNCTSKGTCRKCNQKHNTFVHLDSKQKSIHHMTPQQQQKQNSNTTKDSTATSASTVGIHKSAFSSDSTTLLKTALVDVLDSSSVKHSLRVFIDEGGQGSLIRESTMHELGLRKEKVNVTITGVGGTTVARSSWKTFVRLYSQVNSSSIDVELFAVPKVNSEFARLEVGNPQQWKHIANLPLADPLFHEGGHVDILLGSNIAPYILKENLRKLDLSSPVAQETIFGWVLFGNVGTAPPQSFIINNFKCEISEVLQKFWEIENVPSVQPLTREEGACEQHFMETHERQADGRYMLRLPFNEQKDHLGESRDQAYRRLMALEKRFHKGPQFKDAYIQFMREYEELGHMEKVTSSMASVSTYYLPHHFVLKADSTTTKQRTVFDGSARTTTGVSLNDALLVGATVQSDLYSLILRFRYNRVALKADVAKMYRQFLIHEDDRDFQRILWREDSSGEILEYRLTTVTYGTSCAPFLATRTLNQLAIDEKDNYPAASQALLKQTYVDDFLGTSASTKEAIKLVKEMIGIISSAGMEIRKWCSNDPAVLQAIPEQLREECELASFDDNTSNNKIKALGIQWEPASDKFLFTVIAPVSQPITKRFVLSEISKTFDPVGWLSPVTMNAKLLLQKVWLEGTDWDNVISTHLQEEWKNYVVNLLEVKNIRIPRCVIYSPPVHSELHGFCDSSELCYASAVYLKCSYQGGTISVHLLTSRTKVAPIKHVSLPKLELCGAKLLAETMDVVQRSLDQEVGAIFCWTDSTITLRWISAHSRKWKTFVANRVSTIQTLVPPEHWHHVRSEDNPADLPSRGISTQQLQSSVLWWHGPSWLQHKNYPLSTPAVNEEEVRKEERAKQLACFHLSLNSTQQTLFSSFSSFRKLSRCTAYLLRFLTYLKSKKQQVVKGALTVIELKVARQQLIKWVQEVSFPEEIHQLERKSCLPPSSKLLQLNPFIDANGLLRVGGRLQNAQLSDDARHPIILPHNHQLIQLIISDVHLSNFHSAFTLTYSTIRRNYWILRGRDTIRHAINKCITCRRAKATATQQLMGNLPAGRVTANRPFLHVGVDYAGPFQTKWKKGRHFENNKSYFAIFVCLTSKAVHLEAVSSLSSEAFIACFERFSSLRGIPAHVYSDCGTNFVGADRILNEFLSSHQSTFQHFAVQGTQWHFNPPSSPHQGGLWEAGVKSVKYHFRRVVGQQTLTWEQFQTLLAKISACLNSRPLCPLSSDPADLDALTPGHFLIGEPMTTIPEPDISNVNINRLTYWESIRQLTQSFWKRWSNEYLTSLQQRFKWKQKRENVEVGDLVVVADDQNPVAKWKLGRIFATHPGKDGLVRSAIVKTIAGMLDRPITKLCPLIKISDM